MILCSRSTHYVLLNSVTLSVVELASEPSLMEFILLEKFVVREIWDLFTSFFLFFFDKLHGEINEGIYFMYFPPSHQMRNLLKKF